VGTNQATALQLSAQFNEITGVVAGTGVALPSGATGTHCIVRNSGANPLLMYPKNGDSAAINSQATNSPIMIPVNTTAYIESTKLTQWYTIP
jgi:hypothetical protein